MKVIFYADIFLLVNLVMNYVVLKIMFALRKKRVRFFRVFASSLLGAAACLALYRLAGTKISGSIISGGGAYLRYAAAIAVSSLAMLPAAFGRMTAGEWVKALFQLLGVTYLAGGIAGTLYTGNAGIFAAVLAFALTCALMYILLKVFTHAFDRRGVLYGLRLTITGRTFDRQGFLDTGNCLYDPFYGYPVIIIEADDELMELLKEHPERRQLIPYRTIGCETKIMLGIRPDYIEIETGGGSVLHREKVIAAISEVKLSADSEYNALLHSSLFL